MNPLVLRQLAGAADRFSQCRQTRTVAAGVEPASPGGILDALLAAVASGERYIGATEVQRWR